MKKKAVFIFEGTLQDFLPNAENRNVYDFTGTPSIKDAIEAQGVPHAEVNSITVNGIPGRLNHKLQSRDQVQAYPYLTNYWSLNYDQPKAFIVDAQLGKLAKELRTLGFDSVYDKNFLEQTIIDLAAKKKAIILTRNIELLKNNKLQFGYWLRSQDPKEQTLEVIRYFALVDKIIPFTRCRVCNGQILEVEKHQIVNQIPPLTNMQFEEFFQCQGCHKIYWKGSHYEKMEKYIDMLKKG